MLDWLSLPCLLSHPLCRWPIRAVQATLDDLIKIVCEQDCNEHAFAQDFPTGTLPHCIASHWEPRPAWAGLNLQ